MDILFKLAPFISIILVFITWSVVYVNATKISSRTETKSINDEVIKMINKINDSALSFWSEDVGNITKEKLSLFRVCISSEILKLLKYNEILSCRGLGLSMEALAEFNDIVTLNCESMLTGKLSDTEIELKLNGIIGVSAQMQIDLYKQYEQVYKIIPPGSIFISLVSLILNYDKKLKKEIDDIYK
ncbi:hypothetical protein [Providencia sp. PROV160]|uniref:hypothetical protein n=1 Tax=Providencia sp. PROV160 TaxID=2949869 RepID=UPI00234AEF59|nr:hypothetical protein [Providencia sp. PROV160]